jgi:hypothetical protein
MDTSNILLWNVKDLFNYTYNYMKFNSVGLMSVTKKIGEKYYYYGTQAFSERRFNKLMPSYSQNR